MLEWKRIEHNGEEELYRAKVVGGWLVKTVISSQKSGSSIYLPTNVALTFIPDMNSNWEINKE